MMNKQIAKQLLEDDKNFKTSTRDELKEKDQTVIQVIVNTTDKKIIQSLINLLAETIIDKFDLRLTWDIQIQEQADPHTDCEIWSRCPLWIREGRREECFGDCNICTKTKAERQKHIECKERIEK